MGAHHGDRARHPVTAQERVWLARIETQLGDDDPALAEAFRRWRLPPRCDDDGHGSDTIVPAWAGLTLLSAFALWIGGPAVGFLLAILAVRALMRCALGGWSSEAGDPDGQRFR